MSDLVERLRGRARAIAEARLPGTAATMLEAADELARLRHDIDRHVAIAADLATEVERLRALTEWRFDMENAPRDGETILLGSQGDEDTPAMRLPGYFEPAFDDGSDYMGHDGGFVDSSRLFYFPSRSIGNPTSHHLGRQPTCWLPLPPPPVKKG